MFYMSSQRFSEKGDGQGVKKEFNLWKWKNPMWEKKKGNLLVNCSRKKKAVLLSGHWYLTQRS